MPFELPANPTDPDDEREAHFVPLSDVAPEMAEILIARYVERWLPLAELAPEDPSEAIRTVELKVAYYGDLAVDTELRLRSWYTGSTYWHNDWDESLEDATEWIESVAELQASNALADRVNGPRLWEAKYR